MVSADEAVDLQENQSSAITKGSEMIDELSFIEKLDRTTNIDHSSTLLISSTNDSWVPGRSFVLTSSSLDENQKVSTHFIAIRHSFEILFCLVTISFIHHSFWSFY